MKIRIQRRPRFLVSVRIIRDTNPLQKNKIKFPAAFIRLFVTVAFLQRENLPGDQRLFPRNAQRSL